MFMERIKKLYSKLTALDRYIIKQVIEIFVMGIVIFTSIVFASDTFITLIKQISMYGIPFHIALMIIVLNLPAVIVMTIPMGTLFATVMTLNRLSLASELTVMRACGVSINRIAKPIFIFGVVMALVSFIINETIVPVTTQQSKTLALWSLGQKNIPEDKTNFTFKELQNGEGIKRLFYVQHCKDNMLYNVTVLDMSNKDLIQIIQSKTGGASPAGWEFSKGAVYTLSNEGKVLNTTWFGDTVVDFGLNLKDEVSKDEAQQYNFIALMKYLSKKKYEDPKEYAQAKIQLHDKLALPVTTFVFVLIGVPLAITPPRVRYNRGFLFCILIIFVYYLIRALSISFGESQTIPAFLAAWAPNIVITIWGAIMYYKKAYTIE